MPLVLSCAASNPQGHNCAAKSNRSQIDRRKELWSNFELFELYLIIIGTVGLVVNKDGALKNPFVKDRRLKLEIKVLTEVRVLTEIRSEMFGKSSPGRSTLSKHYLAFAAVLQTMQWVQPSRLK